MNRCKYLYKLQEDLYERELLKRRQEVFYNKEEVASRKRDRREKEGKK